MTSRNQKKIIFTKHFIEKAILKGVFDKCGFENGKKITEDAIKFFGVIIADEKGKKCDFKCIFMLPNRKLITVPITEENDVFIAKTIFPSQQPDINEYKKFVKDLKENDQI